MGAKGRFRLALPLGAALVVLSTSGSSAAGPTIDATGGAYGGYYWAPAHGEVSPGGSLTFRNNSGSVPHGVSWTGGPETPACSGVPIDDGKTSWSGTCSFTQAGTYTFVCYVHPTEMKGTITASVSAPPPTSPYPPPGPTPAGPVASDLKFAKSQRGGTVRGSIELLRAGPGSRLEVDLEASRALLGAGRTGKARVGRLVRSGPPNGHFAFSVSLVRAARNALSERGSLPLSATVTVTAADGEALKRTRGVVILGGDSPGKDRG